MLPILSEAWVIKKCEYLPSAEYPAVIITTPAMNLPRPSVTPEAVGNSVSMFSLIAGARAGISFRNSGSVAARQRVRIARAVPVEFARINAGATRKFIRMADDNDESPIYEQTTLTRERPRPSIEYNRFCIESDDFWWSQI